MDGVELTPPSCHPNTSDRPSSKAMKRSHGYVDSNDYADRPLSIRLAPDAKVMKRSHGYDDQGVCRAWFLQPFRLRTDPPGTFSTL